MKMKTTARPPGPRRVPRRMVKTLHARAASRDEEFDDYEGESEPNMKLSHAFVVVLVLHILAVGGVFAFNTLKSRNIAPDRTKPASTEKQSADTAPATALPGDRTISEEHSKESAPQAQTGSEKNAKKVQQDESGTSTTYTVVAGDTLHRIAVNHKTTVEALEQANNIGSTSAIRVGLVLKIPTKSATAATKPALKQEPVSAKTTESKPVIAAKTTEPSVVSKPAESQTQKVESKSAASEKTYTVAKGDNPYSIAKKMKVGYNDLIKANNIQDPTKLQIGQKLIIP